MAEKVLMKGNEALAEAAVRVGCRFYAGYPITPQTEIIEYLSWRMPEVGGTVYQAESELSGINMIIGAAAAGGRVLTTSSGPGFSLYQEGLSLLAAYDFPAIIIDVMRVGSGPGDIRQGQGDYWQITRGGGNGDYRNFVLAPNSVQESVDLIKHGYEIAEKWRCPVIIASDATIGQTMEPVVLPEFEEHDPKKHDSWRVRGNPTLEGKDQHLLANVFMAMDWIDNGSYYEYYLDKCKKMEEAEQMWESYMVEDAELVLVAYGCSSRIARETVELAREEGLKLGLIRPITLWPFPNKAFEEAKAAKAFCTVEINILGQMVDDVRLAIHDRVPVDTVGDFWGVPDPDRIIAKAKELLGL